VITGLPAGSTLSAGRPEANGWRLRDLLAEGWTHADAVIGNVTIGDSALADATLAEGAKQFIVVEAKLFSPLSPRVTNASYFDQAARQTLLERRLHAHRTEREKFTREL
jgi:hypothetical protein